MKLPAVVLIKIFKSFEYVVFLLQSIQVHSGWYELRIINGTISINISLFGELKTRIRKQNSMRWTTIPSIMFKSLIYSSFTCSIPSSLSNYCDTVFPFNRKHQKPVWSKKKKRLWRAWQHASTRQLLSVFQIGDMWLGNWDTDRYLRTKKYTESKLCSQPKNEAYGSGGWTYRLHQLSDIWFRNFSAKFW